MSTTIIGLDLAKNVFQVRDVDAKGKTVLRKRLRRSEMPRFFAALGPCVIGIEACGSGHHWARELQRFGHQVRLMPPQYVRPYVKTNKHDAADAEAICEAVQRPRMRFVPIKGADQQAALLLHRARELLLRQRTMLANAIRAHAAEFGLVVAKGIHRVPELGPVPSRAARTTRPATSLPGRHPAGGSSSRNVSPRLTEKASTSIHASAAAGLTSSTSDRRTWPVPSGTNAFMGKSWQRLGSFRK